MIQLYPLQNWSLVMNWFCFAGYYSLCIDNTASRFASKLVSLYVASFKRDEWEKYIQELTDAEVTVGNFTNSLRNVDNNIATMIKSLDHSRRINSHDWYLVDGNNRSDIQIIT